jgi:hypothetical protein
MPSSRRETKKIISISLVTRNNVIIDYYIILYCIAFLEHLNEAAGQFKKGAKQVERHMWWKDMKLRLIICAIVIILLIVIIGKFIKLLV